MLLLLISLVWPLFAFHEAKVVPAQPSLYNASDPIVLLTTIDFQHTILATSNAWLVEFYSSWCGHCIDFAPAFRELANDVKDWGTVIKIAAVDCALNENARLCRDYEVMAYPTLKFFPAFSTATQLGIRPEERSKKVDIIRHSMIDFVEQQTRLGAGASHWPQLGPIGNSTLQQLWNDYRGHKTLILLFEAPRKGEYWSRELILDFFPLKIYPPIVRVTSDRDDLMNHFKINSLPTLVLADQPDDFSIFAVRPDRQTVAKAIHDLLDPELEEVHHVAKPSTKKIGQPAVALVEPTVNDIVYMVDLEKAIFYSLGHEVILHKLISKKHFRALQNYLDVLHRYFPGRRKVRDVIAAARRSLATFNGHIKGDQFAQLWQNAIEKEHSSWPDEIVNWKGCQGSQPHLRGYPCSLWSLWHALTVSHASSPPQVPPQGTAISTEPANLVLRAMKDYIQYFFGCSHCSNHFVDMAEDDGDPIDKIDTVQRSVLWLWKAHNKVNRRLVGDKAEDPRAPKIQFPSARACAACWKDGQFDEPAVYEYLTSFYSAAKISVEPQWNAEPSPKALHSSADAGVNRLQWASLSLTRVDVSLYAIFYLVSSLLLMALLAKVLLNRRYRKRLLGKF